MVERQKRLEPSTLILICVSSPEICREDDEELGKGRDRLAADQTEQPLD